jgi:hypothetical protein
MNNKFIRKNDSFLNGITIKGQETEVCGHQSQGH